MTLYCPGFKNSIELATTFVVVNFVFVINLVFTSIQTIDAHMEKIEGYWYPESKPVRTWQRKRLERRLVVYSYNVYLFFLLKKFFARPILMSDSVRILAGMYFVSIFLS